MDKIDEFNVDLFGRRSIVHMKERFQLLIDNILQTPTLPIRDLAWEEELEFVTLTPINRQENNP